MNAILKRVISLMLCFVLVVGYVPVSAFATESGETVTAEATDVTTAPVDAVSDETEAPSESTEAAEPSSEATEPSGEATEPSGEATEPSGEATEPSTEATEPSTEATEPSTEATEPTEDTTEPTEEPKKVVTRKTLSVSKETATATDPVVVIAASDYQRTDSNTIMTSIMNRIKAAHGTPYGALLGGDYDAGSVSTKASHIEAVDDVIDSVFPGIASEKRIYIQGNHENYAGLKVDGTNLMDYTGAYDTDYYGVYAFNHDDFPWSTSTNPRSSSTLVQATADALGDYLEAKVAANYKKPIFVMSHLPLHAARGDNYYAKLIFDELEAAGEKGLNIIFLCGHNHTKGYDASLGNGSYYLPKGSSLTVVDGTNGSHTDSSISFTYMNYGYLGEIGGSSGCLHQTMTAFEITDSQVTVKRYDTDSQHLLKETGTTYGDEYGYAVIDLSNGTSTTYALSGDSTDGDSGNTDDSTGSGDDTTDDTTGSTGGSGNVYTLVDTMVDGGEYLIVSTNADGDAYAMKNPGGSSSGASMGATAVTIENGKIITDDTDIIWKATAATGGFDLTNGTDYLEGKSGKVLIFSSSQYDSRGWSYTDNQLTETSSTNGYIVYYSNGFTYATTVGSQEVYIFQRTNDSSGGSTGGGSTVTPEGGDWVTISSGVGGTIYTLDTDGLNAGEDYLIVDTKTVGDGNAMTNSSGEATNTVVTITTDSEGNIIAKVADPTNVTWTTSGSSSSANFKNGSYNIYLSYNNGVLYTSTRSLSVTHKGNGEYTLKRDSNSSGYYVQYSNSDGWDTLSTSENSVYLFRKTGTESAGDAEYAKMVEADGTTDFTFTVSRGADSDAALKAVMAGINVQISASADGNNPTTLDDSNTDITWTLASYDGTTAGEYAVTISYKGVKLGTAKVIVPEVTINGISVNPASGAVTVGASDSALVGATITVDVADGEGEDFTVPVTVGMLSGEGLTTETVGTYENLTVSYNGFTATGFTLTVKEKVVNNYPSYPNEGAVKVDKKATGVDFQKTGVARVELMTSGIPMNQGVDVLLVLDTSSSMKEQGSLSSGSRIEVLKDCVDNMITALRATRADGSVSDIDIAVVDFNGYFDNKKVNYIVNYAKDTSSYGVGEVLTDGWMHITDDAFANDNWAHNNISQSSGTNYDHGFQQAYDLLKQKQADNGEDTRKQFVLFMSDGAPFQYNGVSSNEVGEGNEFEKWILGSYTQEEVEAISTIKNPEFYAGNNNGNGQLHRIAEAIKGAPTNQYQIPVYSDTSSSATGSLQTVNGLGATMYSVGFALDDDYGKNPTSKAGLTSILKTIASSEDLFYDVILAEDLEDCFDDFAGAIMYAAENAVFEDKLGASFNIQMANTTVRTGSDDKVFKLDPAPTMEVREYTIWTREELEDANGNLSEENAKKVGTRKTDASGNYIYKTLEVVSFNADGTAAYTGDDKTNNIMAENGVIYANTFWYNNGTTTVKVDVDGDGTAETDLAPETFIWKVGTIKTTELALSYYVYLDDSLEGEASAGSYETNTYAILSYDNYLGNPCHKDTVSPSLAWLSANVSYAYYLVNKDGKPVNANGEEVTFANREVIVDPTLHSEIPLNSDENWVGNLAVASTGVLDDGNYSLFDYDAKYQITVNSDATGAWNITVGTKKNADGTPTTLPATTYVTGFSDTEAFSNATATNSESYDYTHTTVWFAVVWEPDALDDTVVIDYGLPVDVHVLTNDFFGDFGTLIGVAKGEVADSDNDISTNEIPASTTPVAGNYGTAQVIKPDTGANESNSVIRYELDSMEMAAPEVFTYSVDYTNTKLHNNNGFYYGKLTVIPATTIYYEDEFLSFAGSNDGVATNGAVVKTEDTEVVSGQWYVNSDTSDATQDEDRPGDVNFAFDTVIDANNVYGNDSAYETMATHSLDSAAMVHVDADSYATASFSFYGTGFDVISMTSNTTGTLAVQVSSGNTFSSTNLVRNTLVDTYYGMNEDGTTEDAANSPEALYQVPVIKISGLTYGQYTVKITATYNEQLDHTEVDGYDLYLDAIRIYDPTGNLNDTANDAYAQDGEGWPIYEELRNNVINTDKFFAEAEITAFEDGVTYYTKDEDGNYAVAAGEFSNSATYYIVNTDSSIYGEKGTLFIDCNDATASIADYISYGPNNELYLANGQAIAFTVDVTDNMADVQLGIKVANGDTVTYEINGDSYTVNSTTDMYYSIWKYAENGEPVTIKNVSGGILSLTNIKATFSAQGSTNGLLRMNAKDAGTALMMLRGDSVVEEPSEPETSEPSTETSEPSTEATEPSTEATEPSTEATEPETSVPEETKPENDREQVQEAVKEAVKNVVNTVKNVLKNLFSRWFR